MIKILKDQPILFNKRIDFTLVGTAEDYQNCMKMLSEYSSSTETGAMLLSIILVQLEDDADIAGLIRSNLRIP